MRYYHSMGLRFLALTVPKRFVWGRSSYRLYGPTTRVKLQPSLLYRDSGNRHNGNWWKCWTLGSLALPLTAPMLLAESPISRKEGLKDEVAEEEEDDDDEYVTVNWSGTHTVKTKRYYEPETLEELERIVLRSNEEGLRIRPVGSGLSPNGLGFDEEGMINLALLDNIVKVDKEKMQVTVQAGAKVSQVVEALRPYELTLQNYASIAEQQIGGLIQVGAHGTGVGIPPIDQTVVGLKVITPGAGNVQLTDIVEDESLLRLMKVGLGALGVVYEVTLQCIPAHKLVERTFVTTRSRVRENHKKYIEENRHLRYMWIPLTDKVVVVTCNPLEKGSSERDYVHEPKFSESERLEPARSLLRNSGSRLSDEEINSLSFTTLRDELLLLNPLSPDHVKAVNEVEAEYWSRSQGVRVDFSDKILGFDCGGQQWVSEVAFPVYENTRELTDVNFVEDVLELIEMQSIPAPAPIEQRWTSPSTSVMSPANEKEGYVPPMYSWVGIIMYLPDVATLQNRAADMRQAITDEFRAYKNACERAIWPKYKAVEHWAKIEAPRDKEELSELLKRMRDKYPLEEFYAIRSLFDPKRILSNKLLDILLSPHAGPTSPLN